MADYLPKYFAGDTVTLVAGEGGVTGGQLVDVTGTTATDGACVAGVAGTDVPAGSPVTVFREGVQRLTAAGAITQGQPLKAAAGGAVTVWANGTDAANLYIGDAWSAASAAGDVIDAVLRF